MSDLNYIEYGYFVDGYYVYTADAESSVSAESTVTCAVGRLPEIVLDTMSCQSTVTCDAVYTAGAVINQVSLFTPSFYVNVAVNPGADLAASFVMTSIADANVRQVSVTLQTLITLSLQSDVIVETSAALSATFTHTESSVKYVSFIASSPHPFRARGEAHIVSSPSKFGSGSLYLPTTGSYGYTADSTDWDLDNSTGSTTQAYSLDLWIYPTQFPAAYAVILGQHSINGSDLSSRNGWSLTIGPNGTLRVYYDGTSSFAATSSVALNGWNHIRICRDASASPATATSTNIWVNGFRAFNATTIRSYQPLSNRPYYIGGHPETVGGHTFLGYIDAVHYQVGVRTTANAATITVPTVETLQPSVYSKLLLNFNGSWFDQSRSQLADGAALVVSQASLSVTVTRLLEASAALELQSSVVCTAGFVVEGSAALTCQGFVLAEGTAIINQANLIVNANLNAQVDDPYLQLIYGSGNTSGYITSTGADIITAQGYYDYSAGAADPDIKQYWLTTGAFVNLWFKIDVPLSVNQSLTIYESGSNALRLVNENGVYKIVITHASVRYWWKPGYIDYVLYNNTPSVKITLASAPTSWTNLNGRIAPAINQTWTSDGADPPNTESTTPMGVIWGNYQINGVNATAVPASSVFSLGTTRPGVGWQAPTYSAANAGDIKGGQWGADNNTVDLFIDQVWVKDVGKLQSSAGGVSQVPGSHAVDYSIPASEFVQAGKQAYITNGLTVNGYQAEVWLPWRDLRDKSNLVPTWNYVSVNRVLYGYVKTTEAAITANATVYALGQRVALATANIQSQFNLVANVLRIRLGSGQFSITADVSATATNVLRTPAALNSSVSVEANLTRIRYADANLLSQSNLVANNGRLRDNNIDALSAFELTNDLIRIRNNSSDIQSQSQIAAEALRIKQLAAEFDSVGAVIAATIYIGNPIISIQTFSSLQADTRIITDTTFDFYSESTVSCEITKTTDFAADLSVTASTAADVDKLKIAIAALTSQASVTATVFKTNGGNALLSTQAIVDITPLRIRDFNISLNTTTVVSVPLVDVIVEFTADMSTEVTMWIIAGVSVRFEADLRVEGFVLTAGRAIHLDPDRQLIVPSENRYKLVTMEIRNIIVPSETRMEQV